MLLSRLAQRLYWLARYVERIENSARLIEVHAHLIYDLPKALQLDWYKLVEVLGLEESYEKTGENKSVRSVLHFLLSDIQTPASLANAIDAARENLRSSREVLPKEAWLIINELSAVFKQSEVQLMSRSKRNEVMSEVILLCQAFWGMLDAHLSRHAIKDFLMLGKYLERADMTSRLLDEGGIYLARDVNDELWLEHRQEIWATLLKSSGGYFPYRQVYQTTINAQDTIAFLLLDDHFPKSILHCWKQMELRVQRLCGENNNFKKQVRQIRRILLKARDKDFVLQANSPNLRKLVDAIQKQIGIFNQTCYQTWFAPESYQNNSRRL